MVVIGAGLLRPPLALLTDLAHLVLEERLLLNLQEGECEDVLGERWRCSRSREILRKWEEL